MHDYSLYLEGITNNLKKNIHRVHNHNKNPFTNLFLGTIPNLLSQQLFKEE